MRLVIKIAGALLESEETVQTIARQITELARAGHELLVIHGGGKIFTATLTRMGITSRFVNGLRVTDRETRDAAVMVFGGLLNKRLAGAISLAGQPAVGISASDAACFLAEPMQLDEREGGLGFVGYLTEVNVDFLRSLWRSGIVPVASCLGLGADGELYNINADHMAAAAAEFIHADRLIFLTDVAGVLDGEKVLRAVRGGEIEELIRQNKVSGGMILKLEAAKRALAGGVSEVRIVGGTLSRALVSAVQRRALPRHPRSAHRACGGQSRARSPLLKKLKMARKKNSAKAKPLSPAQIRGAEARYLMNTYRRPPLVFTHGRGCRLYDSQGREYLDFLGGIAVNALGHAHPRLVRVIRREAGRAMHVSNLFHNPFQGPLARKLVEWSGLDRVFFTNSGTEAIDGALKLARAYAHAKSRASGNAPKTRILALENSFHGRTFGALSITHPAKYREPFAPLVPGVEFVRFNDVADLEAKFDDTVCALVLETIQGEGGIFPVSEAFWERARALATQHDAALIADEIQCGLGRTGRHFAYQKFVVAPGYSLRSQNRSPAACRSARSSPTKNSHPRSCPECTAPLSAAVR